MNYAHNFTAGSRANQAVQYLDNDMLRRLAPSVFAEAPHESRSSRYDYIPTSRIVDGLREEGFEPVKVITSRTSDESKKGFEKHMIRFRQRSTGQISVGDTFPEVVLVNSHDGSTSYNLMAGLFRLACSNGMIVPQDEVGEIHIRHKGGQVIDDVIDASFTVLDQSMRAIEVIDQWKGIELDTRQQAALAVGAHYLKFADKDGQIDTPITPDQLLTPRRVGDRSNDLWSTFNVVQENVIKGGLRGVRPAQGQKKHRRVTTREVKGIDGNVHLNKALWKLAEALAVAN